MRAVRFAAALLGLAFALAEPASAQVNPPGTTPRPRQVWAAQKVPESPYVAPNRLIWRISEILAAHKGQQSWVQPVTLTRDFDGQYVSMAPGEKTKSQFYADDRAFWFVYSGQMRVNIETQAPFTATKGFLVNVAPRLTYSIENTGKEPVVFFRVTPAGQMPSYPITETPPDTVPGWKYVKTAINDVGGYDALNTPYLDFNKDMVAANAKGRPFLYDGHTSANMIRGMGVPTPPPTDWGHLHENMVELWCIIEGKIDVLVSGEQLVTGEVGDIIQAPNERWHRATSHEGGMATRLAITPRHKEGQVHYYQEDYYSKRGQ